MELGGGGWSWVEVGARFSNTRKVISENKNTEYLTSTMCIVVIKMLQKFMNITSKSEQAENTKNAEKQKD